MIVTTAMVAKLDAVLRRLCKPTAGKGRNSAQFSVSDEIKKAWAKGGTPRKELLSILIEYQGDKDRREPA